MTGLPTVPRRADIGQLVAETRPHRRGAHTGIGRTPERRSIRRPSPDSPASEYRSTRPPPPRRRRATGRRRTGPPLPARLRLRGHAQITVVLVEPSALGSPTALSIRRSGPRPSGATLDPNDLAAARNPVPGTVPTLPNGAKCGLSAGDRGALTPDRSRVRWRGRSAGHREAAPQVSGSTARKGSAVR